MTQAKSSTSATGKPITYKPGKGWKETIAPDEATRYAGYADAFAKLQERKSKKYGNGRGLHRKPILAASGTLTVLGKLPPFAAQGLFAKAGAHDVWLRLSNGGPDVAHDTKPDIRGFAMRVFGVQGDSALGNGPAVSQDFLLINQAVFAFPNSDEFVGFVIAASNGGGALLTYLVKRYGLFAGPAQLVKLVRTMKKRFSGFTSEEFHSAVPMANGPYAVRVRLVSSIDNGQPTLGPVADWHSDTAARLQKQELLWDVQLQPFVDEATTPIETANVDWPTPYTTVARLRMSQQDINSPEGKALATKVEAGVIDPWQALAAHRPLGDVQRARKVVYFKSQQTRGAA